MHFGLAVGSEHTVEEVGQNFAVTRECIRQTGAQSPGSLHDYVRPPARDGGPSRSDVAPPPRLEVVPVESAAGAVLDAQGSQAGDSPPS